MYYLDGINKKKIEVMSFQKSIILFFGFRFRV